MWFLNLVLIPILNNKLILVIPFLPLLGAVYAGLFGRFLGKTGSTSITFYSMVFAWILSCIFCLYLLQSIYYRSFEIQLTSWITCGAFNVYWGGLYDGLTTIMLVVVTTISTLVHLYSIHYMSNDPHLNRFMAYISFFTFFMLMLITANNFIQLFFGWEGVGLCSYLLISFWFTRIQANKAAIKALIVNRVGDFGLLFGILIIFNVFKSVDFDIVFSLVPYFFQKYFIFLSIPVDLISIICFLLFIGSMGKSAQIGLHTWLPDAMEGPTPVSALIHAATMVTAGVFLIIRCSPIFEYAPTVLAFIVCVGSITSFFAASIGLVQNDIKKVIAYSTCSQLGYMVFACGLSGYNISLFHLFNHAFFKALLFLAAGAIIHALLNEQDLRRMGKLLKIMPIAYISVLIGSLALMGFPFLAGFYSKDAILEIAHAKYTLMGSFSHWLGTLSAIFTAFYSFRLIYWIFLSPVHGYKKTFLITHELSIILGIPLILLSITSIFSGYIFKDIFLGLGSTFFCSSIFISVTNYNCIEAEFMPVLIKLLPTYFSIEAAFLAHIYNNSLNRLLINWQYRNYFSVYEFICNKWHFDTIYNFFLLIPILRFSYRSIFSLLDKGFLEFLGPQGLSAFYSKQNWKKRALILNPSDMSTHISLIISSLIFGLISINLAF